MFTGGRNRLFGGDIFTKGRRCFGIAELCFGKSGQLGAKRFGIIPAYRKNDIVPLSEAEQRNGIDAKCADRRLLRILLFNGNRQGRILTG